MLPELAIIVPTLNEAGNVHEFYKRLAAVLGDTAWEVIFVDDDSADNTRSLIRQLAAKDARVRIVHRIQRRGLASACVEGMLSSFAPLYVVMDADLQHDENLLPEMLKILRAGEADMVVASRFAGDKMDQAALSSGRHMLSKLGNKLAGYITKVPLTDPLSGFFMLRREVVEAALPGLSNRGFKILVDILASSPKPPRVAELPFVFRARHAGESKLDPMVMAEYAFLLADKTVGRFVPVRFALFIMVGMVGVLVHFAVLLTVHHGLGLTFELGQILALFFSMTANYIGNNWFTYRDRRLKGRRFWIGLCSFYLACSFGAVINYQISETLHLHGVAWQLAGLVGAVIGAVWNYGVTTTFTWRPKKDS